ncbi:MAG: XdhC family protein [Candidatus Paceibacterota bacterium]|jgi:xanthine dehydrogenase accessory factor
MKKDIFDFLISSVQNNERGVLLTVVSSSGHAPGREGFAMAVTKDRMQGTIGGGAIEKNMVNTARTLLVKNETIPFLFHREHKISAGKNSSGMICGGTQTIALHPIAQHHLDTLKQCAKAYGIESAPKTLRLSSLGIECLNEARETPHSFIKEPYGKWVYEETLGQKYAAYIFGGGHVCLALSPVLAALGFRITVLDERPLIQTLRNNTSCDELFISQWKTLPNMVAEGPFSYVFIMTPSHVYDETVLRELLGKDLKYLGMMASKTKADEIFARLEKEGFSKETLETVHSPIGLPIKSHTPAEIAISIAAEVIRAKNST